MNAEAPARLVFLHLQKTGGTSLHARLTAAFPPEAVCPERFDRLHEWDGAALQRFALYSGHFNADSIAYIAEPKQVVTVLRAPRERLASLYLFWTRHGAAWAAAHPGTAAAVAREHPDFASFLASPRRELREGTDNELACRLAGWAGPGPEPGQYLYRGEPIAPAALLAKAEDNLRRIAFVGVTDALDELHQRVAAAWNLPDAATPLPRLNHRDELRTHLQPPRALAIDATAEAWLERLTWMDARLHALARELAGLGSR
jgi:hypothetical protein